MASKWQCWLSARSGLPSILAVVVAFSMFMTALASPWRHKIRDHWADIRDLDVGDLDDMESDVPPTFMEELQRSKKRMPSFQDMKDKSDLNLIMKDGTQLSFAVLKQADSERLGDEGTKTLAKTWTEMLSVAGINIQIYPTDPGRLLFLTNQGDLLKELKDFALIQPELDYFEIDHEKFFPDGRDTEEWPSEEREKRETELGWRAPKGKKATKTTSKGKVKTHRGNVQTFQGTVKSYKAEKDGKWKEQTEEERLADQKKAEEEKKKKEEKARKRDRKEAKKKREARKKEQARLKNEAETIAAAHDEL